MSDLPDGKQPSQSRRRFGAPKNWRTTFLATLADTPNISAAAAASDLRPNRVHKTRRENAQITPPPFPIMLMTRSVPHFQYIWPAK